MAHITSLDMEKVQFIHFPTISLRQLSVAMATKPRGRPPNFSLFGIHTVKQHLYIISPTASVVSKELSFKKNIFFLI